MLAKMAIAMVVAVVQWCSYDTGTFLRVLGTPLREGFVVRALG